MSLYAIAKPLVRIGLEWYYRHITVSGLERIPRDGPVFLAANHPNALVDALVVGLIAPRRVHFTAKATIFANPIAARLLGLLGAIPLRRVSDEVRTNPTSAGVVDPSRNAAAFDAVARVLAAGHAVLIFPEGVSHDAPKLAPVRTGLARMARHAVDAFAVRDLQIVPIGLLFERKESPRSRILVQVGEPIRVEATAAMWVNTLTELVQDRLAAVTLNFDTTDDADRLQTVGATLAALLEPTPNLSDGAAPLAAQLAVIRRLERARRAIDNREAAARTALLARADALEQRIRTFRTRLLALQLDPHDLAIDVDARAGISFAIREVILASVLLPIGLWGRLTHAVPIQITRALALRTGGTRDQPAMRSLVIGLVLVLLAYAAESLTVAWLFGNGWALLFAASLVPSASNDLRYGDRLRRARRRARAYRQFRADRAMQRALCAEADGIRREAGELERAVVS